MPWKDIVWNHEQSGNVDHIAENGLSIGDVENVVMNPDSHRTSRSSGRPVLFGYTEGGDYCHNPQLRLHQEWKLPRLVNLEVAHFTHFVLTRSDVFAGGTNTPHRR